MDKKSISSLRREFKVDSYALQIDQIYSVYLKKDSGSVIAKSLRRFNALDTERKQLYLDNFKKILASSIDIKTFELRISDENFKNCLSAGIDKSESLEYIGDNVVRRVAKNFNYDTDIVFNFMRASYYKDIKKKNVSESSEEYVQNIEFILCSVNKVDIPKKALMLAYPEMEFKTNSCLDVTINMGSPLDGFVYPSFGTDYADTDKLVYYSHKPNRINNAFIEALSCEKNFTAFEENQMFKSILRDSTENSLDPGKIKDVYIELNNIISEDDKKYEATVGMEKLINILSENGFDKDRVKEAIHSNCLHKNSKFKIHNLIEDFSNKPAKIENGNLSLMIDKNLLECIKVQRNMNGQKCLVVTLIEDVQLDGINIKEE